MVYDLCAQKAEIQERVPRMSEQRVNQELDNLTAVIQNIEGKLQRLAGLAPQQRVLEDAEVERNINDLGERITALRTQLRSLPQHVRHAYEEEVNSLESQRTELVEELRRVRNSNKDDPEMRQFEQAQQNQAKADHVSDLLGEGLSIANDTNAVGEATMGILRTDREVLENINRNLDAIDENAEKGTSKAKRMFMRAVCNKILIWVIVAVLLVLLILQFIIRFGVLKSDPTPSPSPSPTVNPAANANVQDSFNWF